MSGPLLDAEQVGALLNVPGSWVRQQAREGRIPHLRLGRYVRFDADEIEQWWRGKVRRPLRNR
jgi:excisionase family DNA binding protein